MAFRIGLEVHSISAMEKATKTWRYMHSILHFCPHFPVWTQLHGHTDCKQNWEKSSSCTLKENRRLWIPSSAQHTFPFAHGEMCFTTLLYQPVRTDCALRGISEIPFLGRVGTLPFMENNKPLLLELNGTERLGCFPKGFQRISKSVQEK